MLKIITRILLICVLSYTAIYASDESGAYDISSFTTIPARARLFSLPNSSITRFEVHSSDCKINISSSQIFREIEEQIFNEGYVHMAGPLTFATPITLDFGDKNVLIDGEISSNHNVTIKASNIFMLGYLKAHQIFLESKNTAFIYGIELHKERCELLQAIAKAPLEEVKTRFSTREYDPLRMGAILGEEIKINSTEGKAIIVGGCFYSQRDLAISCPQDLIAASAAVTATQRYIQIESSQLFEYLDKEDVAMHTGFFSRGQISFTSEHDTILVSPIIDGLYETKVKAKLHGYIAMLTLNSSHFKRPIFPI